MKEFLFGDSMVQKGLSQNMMLKQKPELSERWTGHRCIWDKMTSGTVNHSAKALDGTGLGGFEELEEDTVRVV